MKEIITDIISNPVAWYGAALSSTLFIYNILKDRVAVSVSFSLNNFVVTRPNPDPNTYISITVRNIGRRSVTIEKVGLTFFKKKKQRGENLIAKRSFNDGPKRINEGDSGWIVLVNQDKVDIKNISYAWAIDGTGRMYKKRSSMILIWFFRNLISKINR